MSADPWLDEHERKRLDYLATHLASPLRSHGKLVDLPLTVEDWRAVWASYQGFLFTCQAIAKHAIEREIEMRARENGTDTADDHS